MAIKATSSNSKAATSKGYSTSMTTAQVKAVQKAAGITQDGIYGKNTAAAVTKNVTPAPTYTPTKNSSSSSSSSSSNKSTIMAEQTALNAKNAGKVGYVPLVVDGIVGDKTIAARSFVPTVLQTPAPVVTPPIIITPAPVVTPTSKTTTTPTTTNLQQGSMGTPVSDVQTQLKNLGYSLTPDGSYGPQTKSAVMKFQQDNGLVQDGVWGPLSAAALAKGGTTTPVTSTTTTQTPPAGWDAVTYANFKKTNPTLEPTAEDTAKMNGTNSTTTTPQAEVTTINTDANTEMNSELEKLLNAGTKVDTSDSAKLADTIASVLTTVGEAPKVPSASELAAEQRKTLGIDTLENQNNDVTAQLAKMDADYKALDEGNTNRVQGMSQINRRKSADQIIYEKARGELVLEQNRIADQLTTKYGILNTFMQYNQTDYTNAVNSYNGNYGRAIDLINLFKGVQDDQKSETEKTQDDAKANLQIVMTAVGSTDWSDIDVTNQALITKLEAQSGLPSGFTQAVIQLNSENATDTFQSIGSSYTDASGKKVTPVYYKDPTTGVISAQLMTLGSVQKTSTTTTDDVANFTDFLKTGKDGGGTVFGEPINADGWADPEVYITAFNNWPGTKTEFLSKFPVKTYILPDSYHWLPASIQPTTTSSTRSS